MGAPVRIENVVVRYAASDRNAVDDVSLDVIAGELVVLLGPSGCGKSTLLRTINRLIVPDAGRIEVDGRDVRDAPPEVLRRGIGYVIQAVGLFPHMTIGRNVGIVPELLGWERERIAQRVDELLALVKLDPERYRARLPRELSGGEQQRVGVARAIAAEPHVLLMDEPFGAVDAIVRTSLQDETLRIHRALGTTIFFVTHDVDEALRIADRIVVMDAGKIVQADVPLRLLAKPATPYVERLLDTRDAVRRLQLIRVRDAASPANGESAQTATQGTIDGNRSLREALTAFLEGAERLAVTGDAPGTLGFDDVRRAIVQSES
ncbi:MAG: ABC transporter ATP-binding protein [Candidatus Eremiobacteraeota bacterium]|nr:ABC transporter ATP-binding protein [Candidatus Eremiobacteraeota bacterium]